MMSKSPRLSVIVGCRPSECSPDSALEAWSSQAGPDVEVIAVFDGSAPSPPPGVTLVEGSGLVPYLWSTGLREAGGGHVALTTAAVIPDPNWVSNALDSIGSGSRAQGGRILPGERLRSADWGVYFCRYAAYADPDPESDPAGDNAIYERGTLEEFGSPWPDGFWEPFVHARMRRAGVSPSITPDLVVHQRRGMSITGFTRQRYLHGRHHGTERAASESSAATILGILTMPVVPALMMLRAWRHTIRAGLPRGKFIAASPYLALYFSAWALGEMVGRLRLARP